MNEFCRREYGEKLYKLSLDGGMTCPNRDGTLGTRGCIFCSAGGSGDFAIPCTPNIESQINAARQRIGDKFRGEHFIAYFQSFSNTYAPVDRLRELFFPVAARPDIAVLSIATRPDCLGPDVMHLLAELREQKPLWVELGLQTVKEESIRYIRRGYPTEEYDRAVSALNELGIHTITHTILGLPGESDADMLQTVQHTIDAGSAGIKLQLLHVLKDTDLATDYLDGKFETMTMEHYIDLVCRCVSLLPENMVVHRLTGDGPKKLLLAPLWSGNKKEVLNALKKELTARHLS